MKKSMDTQINHAYMRIKTCKENDQNMNAYLGHEPQWAIKKWD